MAEADSTRCAADCGGKFYIYEHVRRSDGRVFYVGKGSRYRLRVTQHRNPHWVSVARKHGWDARVVFSTDDEELAFLVECELIRKRRQDGSPLTNLTDGGEGMAGYKFPKEVAARRAAKRRGIPNPAASRALRGVPKSTEHRAKLSEARRGRKATDEARHKMSQSRKGRPSSMLGKRHTEAAKAAISAAVSGKNNPFYGKRHPRELVERIRQQNLGRKHTPEAKARMSASRSGERHHNFGKPVSQERKEKQRATLMSRPRMTCPHCGTESNEGNARRWHFDNCRSAK